jgi:hypothetical protein
MMPSFIISIIGVLVVVLVAFFGFTSRGYFIHALLLATPIGILFVNRPESLMVFIFGLYFSQLIIPGLPQGLQLVDAMMALFVVITIARNMILKPRLELERRHALLCLLLLLLVVTIRVRGLGLHASGGGLVGGASYIKLFVASGFMLCTPYFNLTASQIKKSIILMLIGSFLPALAQVVYLASGGSFFYHFAFIQPYVFGLQESLEGMLGGRGEFRLHAFSGLSINLLSLALVIFPFRGSGRLKIAAIAVIAVLMALLSGFRTSLLEIAAITMMFVAFNAPRKKRMQIIAVIAVLLAGLIMLAIPLAPLMPYSIQRTLSWLPFANISMAAKMDAVASTEWRIEVWNYSLSHWKDYMWIGRGFTMNMADLMALETRASMIQTAYLGHNYHSGPISMLLDLGIPGVVVVSSLLLSLLFYALKPVNVAADPLIIRAHDLLCVKVLYGILGFYFIHGDVRSSLVNIFLNIALLQTIRGAIAVGVRKTQVISNPQAKPKALNRDA